MISANRHQRQLPASPILNICLLSNSSARRWSCLTRSLETLNSSQMITRINLQPIAATAKNLALRLGTLTLGAIFAAVSFLLGSSPGTGWEAAAGYVFIVLQALIALLKRKTDRSWREKVERGVERWWKIVEARAMNRANPLNPQRVFWELSPKLPDDVIVSCDCGTATGWYARDIKLKPSM